jgi:hypothetical protein
MFLFQGQSRNFTGITPSVNWISEISLAWPMPTSFLAEIPVNPGDDFLLRHPSREIFTRRARSSRCFRFARKLPA